VGIRTRRYDRCMIGDQQDGRRWEGVEAPLEDRGLGSGSLPLDDSLAVDGLCQTS